jgi:hypothetical protein
MIDLNYPTLLTVSFNTLNDYVEFNTAAGWQLNPVFNITLPYPTTVTYIDTVIIDVLNSVTAVPFENAADKEEDADLANTALDDLRDLNISKMVDSSIRQSNEHHVPVTTFYHPIRSGYKTIGFIEITLTRRPAMAEALMIPSSLI